MLGVLVPAMHGFTESGWTRCLLYRSCCKFSMKHAKTMLNPKVDTCLWQKETATSASVKPCLPLPRRSWSRWTRFWKMSRWQCRADLTTSLNACLPMACATRSQCCQGILWPIPPIEVGHCWTPLMCGPKAKGCWVWEWSEWDWSS